MKRHVRIGLALIVTTAGLAHAQTVIYVDQSADQAPHDGSDWCHAYLELHEALVAAQNDPNVATIRVANGTYKPTNGTARTATFHLIDGVAIEGGYAGCNDGGDARDIALYETILTGDLLGNDGPDYANYEENCYNVVTGTGTGPSAVLDGFTITGGNGSYKNGAGMHNEDCSPTLVNCTFLANYDGGNGGAMYNKASSPTLLNCSFIRNCSDYNGGGAIYNRDDSNPILVNCLFLHNLANSGGAIYNYYSNPVVTNCTFAGNRAEPTGGGGMRNIESSPIVTNSTFTGNYGANTGAMDNVYGAPVVTNCTFVNNSCRYGPGGMENYQSASTITNCIFALNTGSAATAESNQITDFSQMAVVSYSCIQGLAQFTGNGNIGKYPFFIDPDGPDGIPGTEDDNPRLTCGSPCIDAANNLAVPSDSADLDGDGNTLERIPVDLDGHSRFVDDLDTEDTGVSDPPDYPAVVDMGAYEGPDPSFVIEGAPVIVPEGGTAVFWVSLACDPGGSVQVTVAHVSGDEDISILSGQELLFDSANYATPQAVTLSAAEDIDWINGTASFHVTAPEVWTAGVAATEVDNDPVPPVVFVNKAATGANIGTTWQDAFTEVRDALVALANRSGTGQIWVAAGTYTPAPPGGSRAATLHLINDVALYGGFGGWESSVEERDPIVNVTTLSGDLNGDDGPGFANNVDNSYHVVTASGVNPTAVLDGFTISGGNASGGAGASSNGWGGGIFNDAGSPLVANCTLTGNRARYGGAVYNAYGEPLFFNCAFIGNSAQYQAGGLYTITYSGSPTLTSCRFLGNSANDGAAIFSPRAADLSLTNCAFSGNSAQSKGGVLYIDSSIAGPHVRFTNCTLAANSAAYGNAVACDSNQQQVPSDIEFINSILWDGGQEIWNNDGSSITITYSNVYGGWPGVGNMATDPRFVDADGADNVPGTSDDDLRLLPGSPCINAGSNYASQLPEEDIVGDARVQHCRVDLGAYESPYPAATFDDCNGNGQDDDCDIYFGISEDANQNHLPDECQADFDFDGDVDLDDYFFFELCMSLSGPIAAPPFQECVTVFDLSADGDVDMEDFALFQQQFTGPLP